MIRLHKILRLQDSVVVLFFPSHARRNLRLCDSRFTLHSPALEPVSAPAGGLRSETSPWPSSPPPSSLFQSCVLIHTSPTTSLPSPLPKSSTFTPDSPGPSAPVPCPTFPTSTPVPPAPPHLPIPTLPSSPSLKVELGEAPSTPSGNQCSTSQCFQSTWSKPRSRQLSV